MGKAIKLVALFLMGCASLPSIPRAVEYSDKVQRDLGFLFNFIQEVEFAWCSYGHRIKDTLFVERVEMANIVSASPRSVIYMHCPVASLGAGHSHVKKESAEGCGFSLQDITSLAEGRHSFAFLICAVGDTVRLAWGHKTQAIQTLREMKEKGGG